MRYSLLFYLSPDEFTRRAGLEPPAAATSLRQRDGGRLVQDGPFADTKEQLGGFFIIDVPDLDAALEWAARYPAGPAGGVEVRPNLPLDRRDQILAEAGLQANW